MRNAGLLALLLASCGGAEVSSRDAINAANEALVRELPQLKQALDDDEIPIETQDLGTRWRVTYNSGGCGGATVDVDKPTGQATIISIEQ